MQPVKIRLGEILTNNKLITQEQLERALTRGKQNGRKLGRVLVDIGALTEADIAKAIANQLNIPFVETSSLTITSENVRTLPETLARKFTVICISTSGTPKILMADPADVFAYDEIYKVLKKDFEMLIGTETDIYQAIDRYYSKTENITSIAGELSKEIGEDAFDFAQLQTVGSEDAPVVRLLQSIFEDAVLSRASDIHIEPMDRKLNIRFRIDGALHLKNEADPKISSAVAQRLKLISGLNISEKRLPQDGRFNIKVNKNVVDVRIATSPTAHGEAIVMRLLNQSAGFLSLDRIGMSPNQLIMFKEALLRPQGLILVTGPTGSGKTTTLYGALNTLNNPDTKIITVEDPIEYRVDGVNQIQVHEKINLTFHNALRSILRQDPDVILIGEMRDKETVDAALRASITGHLVLSTLHTNDSISAAARLLDMGAEKFMVASSLNLVIAQRLLKLNCPKCKTSYSIDDSDYAWIIAQMSEQDLSNAQFFKSTGCNYCNHTGFYGRIAIYEMLKLDLELIRILYSQSIMDFSDAARKRIEGYRLAQSAAKMASQGLCSIHEAKKIS